MKRLLLCLSLLTLSATSFAENVEVLVNGMVCSFCAHGLDKKFGEEPSVETVKVTLDDKKIRLKLKKNAKLTDEEIKRVVKDAGYDVGSIQRK